MNDTHDRERIHRAIDRTMGGMTGDPFLHARVMAAAKEPKKGGVSMRIIKVAIILAAVLLSVLTAAVAGDLMGYSVNWAGEPVTSSAPIPTFSPWEGYEEAQDLLCSVPHGEMELVNLTYGMPGESPISYNRAPYWHAEDLEEYNARVAEIGYFPQITGIPEGFYLDTMSIVFKPVRWSSYEQIESSKPAEGYSLSRYRLPEDKAVAYSFSVQFRPYDDPDNYDAYITIYAYLSYSDPERQQIIVHDGETITSLNIPGMDGAVAATSAGTTTLSMYRNLESPVCYYDSTVSNATKTAECNHVQFRIDAPAMPVEELIALLDLE